jgi:amino acid permease
MNKEDFKSEYPYLFKLSIFFRVSGVIYICASAIILITGFAEIFTQRYVFEEGDINLIFPLVVGALIMALFSYASAELILLLVRIEFNTGKDKPSNGNKSLTN